MLNKRGLWASAGLLCLSSWLAVADDRSPLSWMLAHQVIQSAQIQNGQGVVVIGPHFFNADFQSQQSISREILQYLQTQSGGSGITQLTLTNPTTGQTVGTLTGNVLGLVGQ